MGDSTEPDDPLRPAIYEEIKKGKFRKNPYKPFLIIGFLGLVLFFLYHVREQSRLENLRAEILEKYEKEIVPLEGFWESQKNALKKIIQQASRKWPLDTNPALQINQPIKLEAWQNHPFVTLKIKDLDHELSIKEAQEKILKAPKDSIGKCLGISSRYLSELYNYEPILDPKWQEKVITEENFERLKTYQFELERMIEKRKPISSLSSGFYFLLAFTSAKNDTLIEDAKEKAYHAKIALYFMDHQNATQVFHLDDTLQTKIVSSRFLSKLKSVNIQTEPALQPQALDCVIAQEILSKNKN